MIHRLFISFPELITLIEQLPSDKSFTIQVVNDDCSLFGDYEPLQDMLFADKEQFFEWCTDLVGWIGSRKINELQARIL